MAGGRKKGDGHPKSGGRKAGTPNKITREKKELIASFIDGNWEEFVEAFHNLDESRKCQIMVDLLPFAVPRLASVEYKDKSQPKTLQDELDEISGEKTRKK